jgi:hypothetical protein
MAREQQTGSEGRRAAARGVPAAVVAAPGGNANGRRPDTLDASRQGEGDDVRRVGRRRAAGPSRGNGAANDDAPSIGGLIFALNQKPTGRPFYYASIGTGVWGVLGLLIAWALLGREIAAGAGLGVLASPAMVATLTAIAVPIALMWFLAMLIWRTQELRIVSSAMTEVAVRLAEPDKLAEQSVASLGQSVRRQVSAMNDAISRAIGRAGELEVLVHNEVAALERSYDENEHRIRSLIDELASERDALANNSERVADTLREVGSHLKDEIANAGERAARALTQASSIVADQLNEKGNSLYSSLSVMTERITQDVPGLVDRLGHEQNQLNRIIEGAGRNLVALEAALAHRTGELDSVLGERTAELEAVFDARANQLQSALDQRSGNFTSDFDERASRLESIIDQRAGDFATVFDERAGQLEEALDQRANQMETSVGLRSEQMQQLLADYTNSLTHRLDEVNSGLQTASQQVEAALTDRAQALDAALIERTRAIDTAFAERMHHLDHHMAQGFEQRLRMFERNVTDGTAVLDGALAERTEALRHAMEGHAYALNDILERQSSGLDQTLVKGIESVRKASETITSQSVQTINSLSMQAKFLKEVSEDLLKQMGNLTDRFETQGQSIMTAATAIETSSTRIDGARQNSDAIRRTLEDQLKAIDTLSAYSRQAASARDVTPPDAPMPSLTASFQQRSAPTRPAASFSPPPYAPVAPATYNPMPVPPPMPSIRQAPTSASASAMSAAREGWSLGDLLARASLDDDSAGQPAAYVAPVQQVPQMLPAAAPPAPAVPMPVQPLDLGNIAQAMEATTAATVWTRLRGGEQGVLVRTMYTRAGQVTFDEIQQRFQADPGFRSMADRYLADFERLLREADAKDPTGRTLEGHLHGDTGRVYLMLAHASGRFQ